MRSGLISVIAALVCALLSSLEALRAAAADTAPREDTQREASTKRRRTTGRVVTGCAGETKSD